MQNTTAALTATFELQEFSETIREWVRLDVAGLDNVDLNEGRRIWRAYARYNARYTRLILVGAPADANVCIGSASPDPVKDAQDATREPFGSHWSVNGRV